MCKNWLPNEYLLADKWLIKGFEKNRLYQLYHKTRTLRNTLKFSVATVFIKLGLDILYLHWELSHWEQSASFILWHLTHRHFMITSSNGDIFRVTGPLCGEFTGPGEFPTQRPVTRSFDVFFDLRLNKRLSKQPWGWWFETPLWSLWRHCNVMCMRILFHRLHVLAHKEKRAQDKRNLYYIELKWFQMQFHWFLFIQINRHSVILCTIRCDY